MGKQFINGFFDEYRFLSNFYLVEIVHDGIVYPSVEHAYQACKTLKLEDKIIISKLPTPGKAKRYGKTVNIKPDWESVKVQTMLELLRKKFSNPELEEKLLNTGNSILVEENTWGDEFWGVCRGKGYNILGRLLMKVRDENAKRR